MNFVACENTKKLAAIVIVVLKHRLNINIHTKNGKFKTSHTKVMEPDQEINLKKPEFRFWV